MGRGGGAGAGGGDIITFLRQIFTVQINFVNIKIKIHLIERALLGITPSIHWFASQWNVRWDNLFSEYVMDYPYLLMPPGLYRFAHKDGKVDFLLFAVLLMNHVWEVRNDLVFSGITFPVGGQYLGFEWQV